MIPISYNVRSLFVRKSTTLATIFGVTLVVFVLSASQMLANGVEKTMGHAGSADNAIVLRKGSDAELASSIDTSAVAIVKAAPGVKHGTDGSPLATGELVMVIAGDRADAPGQVGNALVRGVTEDSYKLRPELHVTQGRLPKPGTNEVIVGKRIRGTFTNIDMGGTFELNKNRPATVVGIFEANGATFESEIWGDVDTLRAAFGRTSEASSVTVALQSKASFDAFAETVEHDKQLGLDAIREDKYYEKQSEGTGAFVNYLSGAIVFFFSIGAMIGAAITMFAAVANRRREIGTLRALGFSKFQVLTSFLFEAVLLALIGGIAGAGLSLFMTFASFSMTNFATWSEVVFSFDPSVKVVVVALVSGGLMGIIGGLFPAISAARTSPLVAMRD
jgi:putative ABC transport system permease protein